MDKCPFCNKLNDSNAGDYYHYKYCEQKHILEKLKNEKNPENISKLRRQLELARFVGD